MSIAYINYAVSSSNTLFISCYHEKITSLVTFKQLGRKHGELHLSSKQLDLELPKETEDIEAVLLDGLEKIIESVKNKVGKITAVYFTADVNLGSGGCSIYPPSLLDDTISDFFQQQFLTEKAPVYKVLETQDLRIAEKAAEIHLSLYAQIHEDNYPGVPVIIQIKRSGTPLYNSLEKLNESQLQESQDTLYPISTSSQSIFATKDDSSSSDSDLDDDSRPTKGNP